MFIPLDLLSAVTTLLGHATKGTADPVSVGLAVLDSIAPPQAAIVQPPAATPTPAPAPSVDEQFAQHMAAIRRLLATFQLRSVTVFSSLSCAPRTVPGSP